MKEAFFFHVQGSSSHCTEAGPTSIKKKIVGPRPMCVALQGPVKQPSVRAASLFKSTLFKRIGISWYLYMCAGAYYFVVADLKYEGN